MSPGECSGRFLKICDDTGPSQSTPAHRSYQRSRQSYARDPLHNLLGPQATLVTLRFFQHSLQVILAALATHQQSSQTTLVGPVIQAVSHQHTQTPIQQDDCQPMQLECRCTGKATVRDPPHSKSLEARKHFTAILHMRQVPPMVAEPIVVHRLQSPHSLHSHTMHMQVMELVGTWRTQQPQADGPRAGKVFPGTHWQQVFMRPPMAEAAIAAALVEMWQVGQVRGWQRAPTQDKLQCLTWT